MGGDHISLLGTVFKSLCCTAAFKCSREFDVYGGFLLWIGLMLYMFKALGVICDEYFVPSLEVIVEKLQLSNDVAGATFMAAGSSAPELFSALVFTFFIVNEGGIGTIVGSAIFNILVIVGATGIIACKEQKLKIWWYPLSRDCFFYSLSIVELMIILSNESVEWYEALIMFLTYCLYCVYMKFNPQIVSLLGLTDPKAAVQPTVFPETEEAPAPEPSPMTITVEKQDAASGDVPFKSDDTASTEKTALRSLGTGDGDAGQDTRAPDVSGSPPDEQKQDAHPAPSGTALDVPTESLKEKRRPSWSLTETAKAEAREQRSPTSEKESQPLADAEAKPDGEEPEPEEEAKTGLAFWLRDPLIVIWELSMPSPETMGGSLLFSMSILFIGICTYLMVDATSRVGVVFHIPPLAMSLVFLAAGTSIPDALGSLAVAKQGEGDMAVANALGSNVFDILIGLGVPWFIKTGLMGKKVEFPGKWDELVYDIGVLVFVLVLFVGCLVAHQWYLTRKFGIVLMVLYFCFLLYNILAVWVIDPPLKTQDDLGTCNTVT